MEFKNVVWHWLTKTERQQPLAHSIKKSHRPSPVGSISIQNRFSSSDKNLVPPKDVVIIEDSTAAKNPPNVQPAGTAPSLHGDDAHSTPAFPDHFWVHGL